MKLGAPHPLPKNRAVPPSASDPSFDAAALTRRQRVALFFLGLMMKVWGRTIRIEMAPADRQRLARRDRPVALVVWHNRLFMSAEIIRRIRGGQPFYGLVSASKDGAWLVGFFELFGIKSIRGSSSRGAREAATAMIETARAGHDVGITPDGPRGPCYEFKPGGLIIARRANLPMLMVGMEFSRAKQLGSWDRFILPLPFSTVRIQCREVLPADLPRDRTAAIDQLAGIMAEINGSAH